VSFALFVVKEKGRAGIEPRRHGGSTTAACPDSLRGRDESAVLSRLKGKQEENGPRLLFLPTQPASEWRQAAPA